MARYPRKIVSGGQTGADRAALDAAIQAGVETGGWVPRGRLAEDGVVPESYPNMAETASADYRERTRLNVSHSDGTLVVVHGPAEGGTAYTISTARQLEKPLLVLDLDSLSPGQALKLLEDWLAEHAVEVLNVAGPRASRDERIYSRTFSLISGLFTSR
ncbi:MAG TPA: putative molybdenum carrier protein [Deltaproteobacteria bacterium]|nr:putative molybdenum carrier protein [Deltaproteobacteria bacterium]HOI05602.1 putative molybdenum carrier protein [Deltaproteobacteria bacterium]